MWDALSDIANRRGLTQQQLVNAIYGQRGEMSFTAAIRVYIVDFYRGMLERAERQIISEHNRRH